MIEKNASTRSSHDPEVGVKCNDDRPSPAAAAQRAAEQAHPQHAALRAAAEAAQQAHQQARRALAHASHRRADELGRFGALGRTSDPAGRLAEFDRGSAADEQGLAAARARITQLEAEPVSWGSRSTGSLKSATSGAQPETPTATGTRRSLGG